MGDDRRRDPRRPAEHLKARVRFVDKKQFERCYLKDISRGGIFLRTLKPAALDAPIEVTLELPGGREVKLNGTVVHCLAPDQAQPGQQPGLGVEFSDLTSRVRKSLEGLIEEISSPRFDVPVPAPPAAAAPTALGRAAPAAPSVAYPGSADFEERKTDPRAQRKTTAEVLIPDQPIIEEEFDSRATPPAAASAAGGHLGGRRPPTGASPLVPEAPAPPAAGPQKPGRAPTPHGVRAAAAASPSKITVDTLRRLLWTFADVSRLAGRSHYEVIGVGPAASMIEIHAACEAMRRAFDLDHPPSLFGRDVDEGVAAVVALIDEIEQCLCDPRRRAEYDRAARREPTRDPRR